MIQPLHAQKEGHNALPIHKVHQQLIQLIRNGNTFKAYSLIQQINKLNGYTVISIKQLKQWEEESNTYRKEAAKKKYRELQKAYMKLLTDQ